MGLSCDEGVSGFPSAGRGRVLIEPDGELAEIGLVLQMGQGVDRLKLGFPEGSAFMNSSQLPVYIREIFVYPKKRPNGSVSK